MAIWPLIRLFKHSPVTLKELLPALSKCLDAKRKVKSDSLEAILYRTICNLTNPTDQERIENPRIEEERIEGEVNRWLIAHSSIIDQVKKNTDATAILSARGTEEKDAFYCQDLGKVTHSKITKILRDKFRAKKAGIGTGKQKERALYFTKGDLVRKSMEYNVPKEIEIQPVNHNISSGPDSFDSILLDGKVGTVGTPGTVLEDVGEGNNGGVDAQIAEETQDDDRVIEPENSPLVSILASVMKPSEKCPA